MVVDITLIIVGLPIGHFKIFLLYVYTFYSHYNMDWIANTETGLDPNNCVIKRLRCILHYSYWYNLTEKCKTHQGSH